MKKYKTMANILFQFPIDLEAKHRKKEPEMPILVKQSDEYNIYKLKNGEIKI